MKTGDVRIAAAGESIAARRFLATTDELASSAGRPCVVMAHGIGATRDCGLDAFGAAFADAGADVVAFDYRHFAESTGKPRQLVSESKQRADYRTVAEYARRLDGIDPAGIVVWGVSLSGGHVIRVAADDPHVAAIIALTPAVDGIAVVKQAVERQGVRGSGQLISRSLGDLLAAGRRRPPVLIPTIGRPGEVAAITTPDALEGMIATAGPAWRNQITARSVLAVSGYRPTTSARRVTCPALVQIGDLDATAAPEAATRAASAMKAAVHHYPCDHFDVYPGAPWHQRVVADQIGFLRRITTQRLEQRA